MLRRQNLNLRPKPLVAQSLSKRIQRRQMNQINNAKTRKQQPLQQQPRKQQPIRFRPLLPSQQQQSLQQQQQQPQQEIVMQPVIKKTAVQVNPPSNAKGLAIRVRAKNLPVPGKDGMTLYDQFKKRYPYISGIPKIDENASLKQIKLYDDMCRSSRPRLKCSSCG